ncbi:MAG: hypothetical protein QOD42_3204 [Sphingomonadales bacterium]|nr:hypothetical protein [Sphingomonadales bacterium]
MPEAETREGDRAAGIVLIAAAATSMLAMAHHPTSYRAGATIGIVHGVMILVAGAMLYGFSHFARRRGLRRPAVLAGLIAYAIGTAAGIGAATINGFVAPALAGHAPAVSHDLFVLAWEANQALAKLGVVATGAAYALWSLDLLRTNRLLAALGLLAGGVPALLLVGGWIDMHLHAAILVYAGQALWAVLVGWLMLRRGLDAPSNAKAGSPKD